ncbi:MAG: AAA family ATPase [bacterium]|nr:AAA family ATPase [bacterium]
MIKKAKRYFNTSGPNIPAEHYTLKRENLISQGIQLVQNRRYFTIWAPRQTGKSTYFRLLAKKLETIGYQVLHTNVENFKRATENECVSFLTDEFSETIGLNLKSKTFTSLHNELKRVKDGKIVLVIDEIEGLNPDILSQFLHTVRNLYHFRDNHALKSVILVGVTNIVGIIQDNASPFNISDNLEMPYFTDLETSQLLNQHEKETGQMFQQEVKEKISAITANQPGLVNGFAQRLVTKWPNQEIIFPEQYQAVEKWYIKEAVDKNVSNVLNRAKEYRAFVENLLFTEARIEYDIERPAIKFLHSQGLIRKDENDQVKFWVPLYKQKLYSAFYPYSNGEDKLFFRNVNFMTLIDQEGKINFDVLIDNYKAYVKKRSFKYFREKDKKTGQYINIKEAALAYSFETYIQIFLQEVEGKSYLEPHTGLGRCDLLINVKGNEYVVEFKIYRSQLRFKKGKKQLAYYCKRIGLTAGIYLVFVPNTVTLTDITEADESIRGINIKTYIVQYDEEKDF